MTEEKQEAVEIAPVGFTGKIQLVEKAVLNSYGELVVIKVEAHFEEGRFVKKTYLPTESFSVNRPAAANIR